MRFLVLLLCLSNACFSSGQPIYKNKTAPVEDRIKDLIGRMTLEEKILQLNQYTFGEVIIENNFVLEKSITDEIKDLPVGIGSLIYFSTDPVLRNQIQKKAMEESRLGIPILFGFDVIHGLRTVYPISLAQACSWNPDLVSLACSMAAKEACFSGIDWTFSPMIDVARDPRWGRVSEGYGEDPYTNAIFGVATVTGYQGKSLSDPYSIAACLKHYVGYGMSEGGRDYNATDISAQSLWETYMMPYEACVKAGAATVMSAFNDISGVPATANHYTLTEVLKQRWNHDGFVISDWNGIDQLIAQGVAKDRKEAGFKAFEAGVEMDMKDNIYRENLQQLLDENKITISKIDDAVSRVLRIKFRLGLFDQPYTEITVEKSRYLQPESKAISAKLAEETMVLLKNNKATLPLSPGITKLAVVGPMAKDKDNLLGSWAFNGKSEDVESIFEGLENEFAGKIQLSYAHGCTFDGTDESGFEEALFLASQSDAVLVCLGEKKSWSGENASRSTIALPAIQEKLVAALKKSGKPIILVLSNGRPLELIRLEPLADAILEIWQPGIAGGSPIAGILSGRINPSGKLAITFPLTTGQIPVYYNMRQSARPKYGKYQDIPTEPLYWFGYGLSYTTFKYGEIKLSKTSLGKNEKLIAEVEISNTGSMDGKETIHWYISDPACSISRPMKELKYFEKKELKSGSTSVFRFEIDPMRDLSYVNANGEKFLESGDFYLIVKDQRVKFEIVE